MENKSGGEYNWKRNGALLGAAALAWVALSRCHDGSAAPHHATVTRSPEAGQKSPRPGPSLRDLFPDREDIAQEQQDFAGLVQDCVKTRFEPEEGGSMECDVEPRYHAQPMGGAFNFAPDSQFDTVNCVSYDANGYPVSTAVLYSGPMVTDYNGEGDGTASYVLYSAPVAATILSDDNLPISFVGEDSSLLETADRFNGVSDSDALSTLCEAGVDQLSHPFNSLALSTASQFYDVQDYLSAAGMVSLSPPSEGRVLLWADYSSVIQPWEGPAPFTFEFYAPETLREVFCAVDASGSSKREHLQCSADMVGVLDDRGIGFLEGSFEPCFVRYDGFVEDFLSDASILEGLTHCKDTWSR